MSINIDHLELPKDRITLDGAKQSTLYDNYRPVEDIQPPIPSMTDREKLLEELFYGATASEDELYRNLLDKFDKLDSSKTAPITDEMQGGLKPLDTLRVEPSDITQKTLDSLKNRIDSLSSSIAGLDHNLNKVVEHMQGQPSVTASQSAKTPARGTSALPRYEVLFDPADLIELDRLLSEIDSANIKAATPQIIAPENLTQTSGLGSNDVVSHDQDFYISGHTVPSYVDNTFERDTIMAKREGWVQEPDGTRKCYKNGKLHCDKGAAEIRTNGTQLFYKDGKLHRDGGLPAMQAVGGTTKHAVNGKYHRVGGQPAITWSKSPYRHEWWEHGEIKRAEKKDGTREWYAPGSVDRDDAKLHREDGPALIHPNGREEFWLDGTPYRSRHEWEVALNNLSNIRENMREEALDHELIDEDPIETFDQEDSKQSTKVSATKEKKMEKPSFADLMKKNAVEAGYRVAATQATNLVKGAIIAVMTKNGADDGALSGMKSFLETEFGAALVSCVLGVGLNYVPHLNEDPRVQKLAEEMRIGGMATAGNAIVGEAAAHILPALTDVLNKLPAVEGNSNVRLEETSSKGTLVEQMEEDEEDAEESSAKKTATV